MNRRRWAPIALACLAAVLVPTPPGARAAPQPPNVLIILTDDQTLESLTPGAPVVMPKLEARVSDPSDHWVRFDQAFLNTPLCCPSRATILTGQYSRHTGVVSNGMGKRLDDAHTLATWLHAAGYRTGLVGKYLNHYPFDRGPYVPPGWDSWFAKEGNSAVYYNYTVNADGTELTYGNDRTTDYSTDVYRDRALSFIRASAPGQPFLLYFAPTAPHAPWIPAKRYNDAFKGLAPTRFPDFNEADVSDKPSWVRALPVVDAATVARLDGQRQREYETLLAVDDAIDALLNELEARGILDDTVVFFLTDNGYAFGEHRYEGKRCEYDECLRTPFLVRYPGTTPGVDPHLVSNVDIAPTIADLAGVLPDIPQDGVSLVPLLEGVSPAGWRSAALIEYVRDVSSDVPGYVGVRTDDYLYVELDTGEVELYETTSDPYELQNLGADPAYAAVRSQLRHELDDLLGTDLEVTGTAFPPDVITGEEVTFTIAVRNTGERTSHDLRLAVPLPASLSLVSASTSTGRCSGAVACDLGDLEPRVTATVTIVAAALEPGELPITASVTSATPDQDPANNEASVSVTVSPPASADLSLSVTDTPDPVMVGSELTYKLTVANAGPDAATDLRLSDRLAAGSTLVAAKPGARCAASGGTVTCTQDTLDPGGSSTFTIIVRPALPDTMTNAASVSAATLDPDESDNQSSTTTRVVEGADLSVRVTDSPDPVEVGGTLSYSLRVSNLGPSTATSVSLSDPLPAGVTPLSASAGCTFGQTVSCSLGDMPPGGGATVTITVRPSDVGALFNTAGVSSATADPFPGNDDSTAETQVVLSSADLSLVIGDVPDPVTAGSDLTYTLTVTNTGPDRASGLTLVDTLPAGTALVSLKPAARCSAASGVKCTLAGLDAGATASFIIVVRPAASGAIVNEATVASATTDPDPSNDDAFAVTQVDPPPGAASPQRL